MQLNSRIETNPTPKLSYKSLTVDWKATDVDEDEEEGKFPSGFDSERVRDTRNSLKRPFWAEEASTGDVLIVLVEDEDEDLVESEVKEKP